MTAAASSAVPVFGILLARAGVHHLMLATIVAVTTHVDKKGED